MVKVVTYILENDSTVQGLLGEKSHGENHKVYPVFVPQSEKAPFIAVAQTERVRIAKDVSCGTEYGIIVAAYCNSYDQLDDLCDAIVDALDGQRGSINGVSVGSICYDNQNDLDFDKDHLVFGRSTTFRIVI